MIPSSRTAGERLRSLALIAGLLAALLAPALASCSGGTDQRSPAQVATAFFEACNRSDYKTANSLASADLKQQMKSGLGASMGGLSGFCDYYTRNGDVKKIEVLDRKIGGQRASVTLGIRFNGPPRDYGEYGEGDHASTTWRLTKEEGGWKLAPSD